MFRFEYLTSELGRISRLGLPVPSLTCLSGNMLLSLSVLLIILILKKNCFQEFVLNLIFYAASGPRLSVANQGEVGMTGSSRLLQCLIIVWRAGSPAGQHKHIYMNPALQTTALSRSSLETRWNIDREKHYLRIYFVLCPTAVVLVSLL